MANGGLVLKYLGYGAFAIHCYCKRPFSGWILRPPGFSMHLRLRALRVGLCHGIPFPLYCWGGVIPRGRGTVAPACSERIIWAEHSELIIIIPTHTLWVNESPYSQPAQYSGLPRTWYCIIVSKVSPVSFLHPSHGWGFIVTREQRKMVTI